MRGEDVTTTAGDVVRDGVAVEEGRIREVAHVGIDAQVGAVHLVDVDHGLANRVHERRLHGLEAEDDASRRCHLRRFREVLGEALARAIPLVLVVVRIVAGELNHVEPEVAGKVERLVHHLEAVRALLGVLGAERPLAMTGKAHGPQGDAGVAHGLYDCRALRGRPVEPGLAGVGLVDGDLHVVEPALGRSLKALLPRELRLSRPYS